MDPWGGFGAYLQKIDWLAAITTAAVAVMAAAVMLRLLLPAAEAALAKNAAAQAWLARHTVRRRAEGVAPEPRWICPACSSINEPATTTCYNGCGLRPASALTITDDDPDSPENRLGRRNPRRGW